MHRSLLPRRLARALSVAAALAAAALGGHPVVARADAGTTATTTTLQSSVTPSSTDGQWVIFTATVVTTESVAATGTVTFLDGATALGTAAVGAATPSVATYATAALAPGSHQITATYGGDATHAASTSSAVSQGVDAQSTALALATSTADPMAGQQVTVTATVDPAAAPTYYSYTSDPLDYLAAGQGGGLTTADAAFALGTGAGDPSTQNDSLLTISIGGPALWDFWLRGTSGQTLHVGTYPASDLTITHGAKGCDATSGGFTINSIDIAPSGVVRGVDVSFDDQCVGASGALHGHIVVAGSALPSGTVTFMDGTSQLGTASVGALDSASITTTLTAGQHTLDAIYAGDSGYLGSTAPTLARTVTAGTDTVALTSSPSPAAPGQQIVLAAIVTPSGPVRPTGSVTFADGATVLGTGTLDGNGRAAINATLGTGSHQITATYQGDSIYPAGTAGVSQSVVAPAAGLSLTASPNPATDAQQVTLSAQPVAPANYPIPLGSVTFSDGSTVLGTANVISGTATLSVGALPIGDHPITATYTGDGTYPASTGTLDEQVDSSDLLTYGASSEPSVPGQRVDLVASITTFDGSTPTGTVTILDGTTQLGSGPLSADGTFDVATALTAGDHQLAFEYSGDANHASRTASYTQNVVAASPNRRFANQLYNDILGRTADDGAASIASSLDSGSIDRTQAALALTMSTENLSNEVQAMYQAHLGRDADASGLGYWVGYIRRGGTLEDLEISFLGSKEYYDAAPTTYTNRTNAEAFIDSVYNDVLGRYPDEKGLLYWWGRLNTGTPAWEVAASLVNSTEAMSNRVTGYYWTLLGRAPDSQGLASWISLLQHGTRDETLLAQLAGSTEYWDDTQA